MPNPAFGGNLGHQKINCSRVNLRVRRDLPERFSVSVPRKASDICRSAVPAPKYLPERRSRTTTPLFLLLVSLVACPPTKYLIVKYHLKYGNAAIYFFYSYRATLYASAVFAVVAHVSARLYLSQAGIVSKRLDKSS